MNVFILDEDPTISASMLCNKHVLKMLVESCQILCNCFDIDKVPYKRTHYNHPCCVWARQYKDNYLWVLNHAKALCVEYSKRYNKIHKCESVLDCLPDSRLKYGSSDFIQAVPDKYKKVGAVDAYQEYYVNDKLHFCKWMSEKQIPDFVKQFVHTNGLDINDYIRL